MKKNLLAFVLISGLLITFNNLYSQSGWYQQVSNTTTHISSVFLADQSYGYFIAGNNLFSTTNGGLNWDMVYNFSNLSSTPQLYFINASTGFLLSWMALYRTTNQGLAWNQITTPAYAYNRIKFLNVNTGFITGAKFSKTINSGGTWSTYDSPYLNWSFGDFQFLNAYTGFSIIGNGIWKTTTGGESWTSNFLDTIPLFSLSKPFGSYMYAVGRNRIFRSTNYGSNWNVVHQSSYFPKMIEMVDSLTGYYLGSTSEIANGVIFKTTNGGYDWNLQYTQNINTFTAMSFANSLCGNVVGSEGLILRTNTGGVVTHINNQEIVSNFKLEQNYPNPFNPTTNIKFAIPKSSSVKITIFDIAGKELETLVNEQLQSGTYQKEWNGSKYASGIYFYKIQAGNYKETKSMLLIK